MHRAVSFVAVLAFLPLQVGAICQDWRSVPEPRMACCAPEAQCRMATAPAGVDHHDHAAQAQADTCCAMSEPVRSGREIAAAASVSAAAILTDAGTVSAFQPEITYALRPAPRPATRVHTHVLLSVFLV